MRRIPHTCRWILLGFALVRGMVAQSVLVFDSFDDGSRFDGADALDTSWDSYHPDIGLGGTPPDSGTIIQAQLSANGWVSTGTSPVADATGSFSNMPLTTPGSTLALTVSFSIAGTTTANTLYGPVIGLFNNGGTPLTADNTS